RATHEMAPKRDSTWIRGPRAAPGGGGRPSGDCPVKLGRRALPDRRHGAAEHEVVVAPDESGSRGVASGRDGCPVDGTIFASRSGHRSEIIRSEGWPARCYEDGSWSAQRIRPIPS